MTRSIVACLFAVTALQAAGTSCAWFVDARFSASGVQFRGMPLHVLSVPLTRLSLFSCIEGNEHFTSDQCAQIRVSGTQFEIGGDFKRDGQKDLAQTGVAQRPDGTTIGVVVISDLKNPRNNQVMTFPGSGLLVLTYYSDTLVVYPCIECDTGAVIKWNASARTYTMAATSAHD